MKFLKFYIKLITLGLHLIILSLAIVAIVFGFKFDFFTSSASALNTYEIYTMEDLTFNYAGIINFSNTLVEFANKNTILNSFLNIKEVLSEVKIIKVLVIAIFVMHGLLGLSQLFAHRTKTTFINCIITTLLIIALRTLAVVTFKETGLIIGVTSYFNVILILWLVATLISGIQITLQDYVKKAK